MMKIIILIAGLWTVMWPSMGWGRNFYSVSVDTTTKAITESAWRTDAERAVLAPQTAAHIASHGVMVPLPPQGLAVGVAWEMDLGVLQDDGNIRHLLGTATVSDVHTLAHSSVATVSATLVGTQDADCRASLQAHVDVTSQQLLVEKLHFVCLGHDVRVAAAALPKEK